MTSFINTEDGQPFKAPCLGSLLSKGINVGPKLDRRNIEGWFSSDEVVEILKRWKLDTIDTQNSYDKIKTWLGTNLIKSARLLLDIAKFGASSHTMVAADFKNQAKIELEDAQVAFATTSRDLVYKTDMPSSVSNDKQGQKMPEAELSVRYRCAVLLLLDTLMDLQSSESYWAARLGGNIVKGWTTFVKDAAEDSDDDDVVDDKEASCDATVLFQAMRKASLKTPQPTQMALPPRLSASAALSMSSRTPSLPSRSKPTRSATCHRYLAFPKLSATPLKLRGASNSPRRPQAPDLRLSKAQEASLRSGRNTADAFGPESKTSPRISSSQPQNPNPLAEVNLNLRREIKTLKAAQNGLLSVSEADERLVAQLKNTLKEKDGEIATLQTENAMYKRAEKELGARLKKYEDFE